MTICYITIDTEYDFQFAKKAGLGLRAENYARSIACTTSSGSVGIGYQMDVLDRNGQKGVFFVDPMPALVWGTSAIADVVGPIIERGHDVQLHIHTEWLELAGVNNPLGKRTGANIRNFSYDEQLVLIDYASRALVDAGAPNPVAFRAGNYGANDDTLRALSTLGIRYDTSHCPGIRKSNCEISLSSANQAPIEYRGVIEVPIGCIKEWPGKFRHAQITALSAHEMIAAVEFAHINGDAQFTLVSHSFELLSRNRIYINKIIRRRFEYFCDALRRLGNVRTGTYSADPPQLSQFHRDGSTQPYNPLRTCWRMCEQLVANTIYDKYR